MPPSVPGFEQALIAISHSSIGEPVLAEGAVVDLLRNVPFEAAFSWTGRIEAATAHDGPAAARHRAQLKAVAGVFDGDPRREIIFEIARDPSRRLFNTTYTHVVQRLLVLAASDAEAQDADTSWMSHLREAFLAATDLASPAELRPAEVDGDHLFALMTRLGVHDYDEPLIEAVTRAYTIYYEMPLREGASDILNYCPVELWQPSGPNALSVHERFMTGLVTMGANGLLDEQPKASSDPVGLPPGYFDLLAEHLGHRDGERLRAGISAPRSWFARQFEAKSRSSLEALNSVPFQVRPLVQQSNGGHLLSSPKALTSWMTRGVHYACLAPIERTPTAQRFLAYVGRLFETYALELLRDVHQGQPTVSVVGDIAYDRGSSMTSDIAVVDDRDLILIEVEAHRFTKEALLATDVESVKREIDLMLTSKIKQLDGCITALTRAQSPAQIPGVDMSNVDRIWPIVVVEGGILQTPLLWGYLDDQTRGLLSQPRVHRLSILNMGDLEILAGLIERQWRFKTILDMWQMPRFRRRDFKYFSANKQGFDVGKRPRLVEERRERIFDEMLAQFSDLQDKGRLGNG